MTNAADIPAFLIPFSPLTAVDLAIQADRGAPVALWRVLYPLWEVEIPGTRIVRRDLEPLEAIMLRAVRDGAARTAPELAALLGIAPDLLDHVLTIQVRIGHLNREGDVLSLARLGGNSLRDAISYRREEGGRGTVFLDGFTLQPLPDPYGRHLMVDPADLTVAREQRFLTLLSARSWDPKALKTVTTARILPDLQPRQMLLPLYIVRSQLGQMVVLNATRERRDPFFEEQIDHARRDDPFLLAALTLDDGQAREVATNWLTQRNLGSATVTQTADGEWRAVVTPEVVRRGVAGLALARIGGYELIAEPGGGWLCLRWWCPDRALRQAAAEAQAREALTRMPNMTTADREHQAQRRSHWLELADAPPQREPTPAARRKRDARP